MVLEPTNGATVKDTKVIVSLYSGYYKNGVKEGSGTFYFNPNESYEGQWKNGRQDGQGKLVKNGATVFDGKFRNGEPCPEDPVALAMSGPGESDPINNAI